MHCSNELGKDAGRLHTLRLFELNTALFHSSAEENLLSCECSGELGQLLW